MKMKKLLYIFIVFSLGLVSCTERLDIPNAVPADCIMLNVFNSPMTKAQNWAGLDYERQLLRLDCFFYPKGQTDAPCVYYQKVDVNEIGSAEIPFYVDESVINTIFPSSDECDVFVIANLTSGTFAKGQTGTDVPTLSKTVLTLDGNRDAIDKPFIMQGLHIATKGDNNNASGTIPLHRAAAKVTITVNIPEKIEIEYENADKVTMIPVLSEDTGAIPFKTAFHNGVKKTYLRDDYSSQLVAEDAHHVGKQNYVAAGEVPAVGDTPKKYTFTCEIPFYTYARAWEKGAEDAAYLTFEMPWTNVSDPENPVTQTYYYQILVNSGGRCFGPNNWYDLTVNVGVIGSTVESEPVTIQDLTYYVLDWTTEPDPEHEAGGDRYEDVNITDYTYFVVHNNRIELNNVTTGDVTIDASHKLAWELEWPEDEAIQATFDKLEHLYHSGTVAAYYINCSTNPAKQQNLNAFITEDNFSVSESGKSLLFNYPKESIDGTHKVYSPVYVHLKIWLDIDGDRKVSQEETDFVEYVTFVYYPSMYIIPEPSTLRSIYVNGDQNKSTTGMNNVDMDGYKLGASTGVKNFDGDNEITNNSMYVITVSSFGPDDFFYGPPLDANGYLNFTDGLTNPSVKYDYIIGDPRQRKSDLALNDSNNVRSWVEAPDLNGSPRQLQNYYPTENIGKSLQIIAPKYRIVSFNNASGKNCTPESAAMRCASLQEDGFPAGRWRLPTVAEVRFIIYLQMEEVIEDIFLSSGSYYATASYASGTQLVTLRENNKQIQWNKVASGISVRCVYDEWYWGSERDALVNPSPSWSVTDVNGERHYGDEYLFTWGDKKIW